MAELFNEYRILEENADSIAFVYNNRELKALDIHGMPIEDRPYDKLVEAAIANTIAEDYRTAENQINAYKNRSHAFGAIILSGMTTAGIYIDNKLGLEPTTTAFYFTGSTICFLSQQRAKVDNIRNRRERLKNDVEDLLR